MKKTFVEVTQEAGRHFFTSEVRGPITMLNLLRFRDVADFAGLEHLKPAEEISGKEAYQLYMKHTMPYLKETGSEVLFYGESSQFLIGPSEESWDYVLLVRHKSKEDFLTFAQHKGYLKTAGYRTAALADSRLLPLEEGKI